MTSPQKPAGDEALADVNVKMAMDVLTNVLPIYGATSEKGMAIMDTLKKLSTRFGLETSKHQEAVPAEVAAMLHGLQGSPGMPPPQPIAGGAPLPTSPVPGA